MTPTKILYVDDEPMALKYFERLVSPLAPVITAASVVEGRAALLAHGSDIAVLVSDQRMPGERGNELLRHAREYYPGVVRMLTTAYSELGEAIEAINTGEIYRYISKPWELESLRADLKNALELAVLRSERDNLLRDRLLAQQSGLLAHRLASLVMVGAAVHGGAHEQALQRFADAALAVGGAEPAVDWNRWDHADLLQAEAQRGAMLAVRLRDALRALGPPAEPAVALGALAPGVGGQRDADGVWIADGTVFTGLLGSGAGLVPTAPAFAWLAWLLWVDGQARVEPARGGWLVQTATPPPRRTDWLADAMERLGTAGGPARGAL